MSGDCGHGWGFHASRAEPCGKCYEAWTKLKAERDALQAAYDADVAAIPGIAESMIGKLTQINLNGMQKAMDAIAKYW